jgi:hypothetical protein
MLRSFRYLPFAVWATICLLGVAVFTVAAVSGPSERAPRTPAVRELRSDVVNLRHTMAAAVAVDDPSAVAELAGAYAQRWQIDDSANGAPTRNAAAQVFHRISAATGDSDSFTPQSRALTGAEIELLSSLAFDPYDTAMIAAARAGVTTGDPGPEPTAPTGTFDAVDSVHETLDEAGVDTTRRPG